MEVTDWSDLKQFDEPSSHENRNFNLNSQKDKDENGEEKDNAEEMEDDSYNHDWYSFQEKKLAEEYGGNFIKVKYASNGRVVYLCELCVAECNAKKSLDSHCNGMKHLKKKDLWAKEGQPASQFGFKKSEEGKRSPSRSSRRDDDRRSPYRSNRITKRDDWKDRSRSRKSPDRGARRRDDRDRGDGDRRDRDRGEGGRGDRDRGGDKTWDRSWDKADRFGSDFTDPNPMTSRLFGQNDPVAPPTPAWGGEYDRFGDRDGFGQRNSGPSFTQDTPAPPSPPKFGGGMAIPDSEKPGLVESPAGSLLQQLSACCVKSPDDADLALNVVASLCKSLKQHSQRNADHKIAELLMEAELKVGTVKALKVGMKMLSNFSNKPKSATEIANDFLKDLDAKERGGGPMPPPSNSNHGFNNPHNSSLPAYNSRGHDPPQDFMSQPMGYPAKYSQPSGQGMSMGFKAWNY